MVRFQLKGGVWKNTEDEILKAAVMKYGLNQWARISSLLVRKSAKQCKARWYEWLDPSIKKTEWTREEEEKLLHLAKIMPTQWRTIAPMVGRTPAQCLEHYEKLLDAAQNEQAGAGAAAKPADDPRKLRPGEIDPHPETRPALPDAIDMDEDEKEMLSEARARMANTKGKKAKRKAREKMMEEARRLAALQKRRELAAAGIEAPKRRILKKGAGFDHSNEMVFQQQPPKGFYDTAEDHERSAELSKDKRKFINQDVKRLEGLTRAQQEELARKRDREKLKVHKKVNLPATLMKLNARADPLQVSRRSKMVLPAPQISDQELEDIARLSFSSSSSAAAAAAAAAGAGALAGALATPAQLASAGGGGATPLLLRTPARTPMAPNTVLTEAQNLLALNKAQTPLLGGENTPLHPSDFSGVAPRRQVVATPNVLATPLHAARGAAAVGATPRRDELGLNTPAVAVAAAEESGPDALAAARAQLRGALAQLPQPKRQGLVAVPQAVMQAEAELRSRASAASAPDAEAKAEEDAEQRLARQVAALDAAQRAAWERRPSAVKRGLPRPARVPAAEGPAGGAALSREEALVWREMVALLEEDRQRYPDDRARPDNAAAPRKRRRVDASAKESEEEEEGDDDEGAASPELLAAAARELDREVALTEQRLGFVDEAAFERAAERAARDLLVLEGRGAVAPGERERLDAQRRELAHLRAQAGAETRAAERHAAKVEVLMRGYQALDAGNAKQLQAIAEELADAALETDCYEMLDSLESAAAPARLAAARAEVAALREEERLLQARFSALQRELNSLRQQ